jgi:chorismate-pyruvate lyase
VSPEESAVVDLPELVKLFFPDPAELGQFSPVTSSQVPQPQQSLLGHHHHMTVTVENHHGCKVDVDVLRHQRVANYYSREILLRRQTDRAVVLYGIVRLSLDSLPRHVADSILERKIPLGRVLIDNGVLRRVELVGLYRVQPGPRLMEYLSEHDLAEGYCYGRTAMIHVDSHPAVELLEIVPG